MTLIAFVIPVIVVVIAAVVAHSMTERYWRACAGVAAFSTVAYLALLIGLGNFRANPLQIALRAPLIAVLAGMIAAAVAAVVGVPFVMDRRIRSRMSERHYPDESGGLGPTTDGS